MNLSKKIDANERKAGTGLEQAAIGLESEFTLYVNDEPARPEDVFGDPKAFLSGDLMHRVGSSYHIPTG